MPVLSALIIGAASLLPAAHAYPSYGKKIPNGMRVEAAPEQVQFGEENGFDNYYNGMALYFNQPAKVAGGVGHFLARGKGARNVFGKDFKAQGYKWTEELCKMDSDGDGFTNGEELGDPCCLWRYGSEDGEYMRSHQPSHPGFASGTPKGDFRRASECDNPSPDLFPTQLAPDVPKFMPGEEQRFFDVKIDNYDVPVQETIYVKMGFNLKPEQGLDQGVEKFHAVFADVFADTPHLHHLVAWGCDEYYKPEHENTPLEVYPPADWDGKTYEYDTVIDTSYVNCDTYIGGWAPGSQFVVAAPNAGLAFGSHIKSLNIDIHYTNERLLKGVKDSSSIRLYYTPTLREHDITGFAAMGIAVYNGMTIPKNHKRRVTTGSCTIQMECPDPDASSDEEESTGGVVLPPECPTGEELHFPDTPCVTVAGTTYCKHRGEQFGDEEWCYCKGGTLGGRRRRLEETEQKKRRINNKCSAQVAFSNFHAHDIGREMYMRLTKKDGRVIDVGSMPVWDFNDQINTNHLGQNITLEEGDKVQCTCVQDSTERDRETRYGLGTFDEMCICSMWTYPGNHFARCMEYAEDNPRTNDPSLLKDRIFRIGDLQPGENGFEFGGPNDPFAIDVHLKDMEGNYDQRTVVTPKNMARVVEAWVNTQNPRKLVQEGSDYVFQEVEHGEEDPDDPASWVTFCEGSKHVPTGSPTVADVCGHPARLVKPTDKVKIPKLSHPDNVNPCVCKLMCELNGAAFWQFKHKSGKCTCFNNVGGMRVKSKFEGKFTAGRVKQ